ncbi:unnamed protein product, partial [Prorocentrum cordatum]
PPLPAGGPPLPARAARRGGGRRMAPHYRASAISSCPSVFCPHDAPADGGPVLSQSSRSSVATASPSRFSSFIPPSGACSLPGSSLPPLMEAAHAGRPSDHFSRCSSVASERSGSGFGESITIWSGMSKWRGRPAELRGGVGGHSICDLELLSSGEDPPEWGREFVIPEASLLRKGWNVVVIALITYTSTIFPFRLCFMEFKVPEPIPAPVEFTVLETLVDVLFCCDLLLNFLFSYQDAHGREIFSLPSIARRYLRGHFAVNLIGGEGMRGMAQGST